MRGAARLGDLTIHGGTLGSGDPSVLINGRPAVRVGDMQVCPLHGPSPVVMGAPLVLVGNAPLARVLDLTMCIGGGSPGAGGGGGGGGGGGAPEIEGPTHRRSGEEEEAYLLRTKRKTSFWIFESETENYVGRVKEKDGKEGKSVQGSVAEETTVYSIGGVKVWETEKKVGAVKEEAEGFWGKSGSKTGIGGKVGLGADAASEEHKFTPLPVHAINALLKPTGYDIDLRVSGGESQGGGVGGEAHLYHDAKDGRVHFLSKGFAAWLEGYGIGVEGSIGKSGGAGGGATGAGALPNPIGTGSPDVLAG